METLLLKPAIIIVAKCMAHVLIAIQLIGHAVANSNIL